MTETAENSPPPTKFRPEYPVHCHDTLGPVPLTSQPNEDEDLLLMAAVASGERRAQATLVRRLAPRVRRLTALLARSSADADDAAQLALLEILRSAESFRTPGNLASWGDRIAARTVFQLRRRERLHQTLLARWLSPGMLPWGSHSEASAEESVGLEKLFTRLSQERREALVLRHALGYSPEEIAKLTGAPLGTVKDRLVTARRQLRTMLEKDALKSERGVNS